MRLIRDDDEACLVELHARGGELLERYRELLDDGGAPSAVSEALAAVVDARPARLDALADRLRARGVLPSAGDPDRAFIEALGDLLGTETDPLVERLVEAESRWAGVLDEARDRDWSDPDRAVLDRLARHIEASIERFEGARDG